MTKFVWLDYLKAGGLAPGLGYLASALVCQALRIYTDLWLSRWTDLGTKSTDSANVHEEVNFFIFCTLFFYLKFLENSKSFQNLKKKHLFPRQFSTLECTSSCP